MEESLCVAMVLGFLFQSGSTYSKKKPLPCCYANMTWYYYIPRKQNNNKESQYSDKINAPSVCPFPQMQCSSNT